MIGYIIAVIFFEGLTATSGRNLAPIRPHGKQRVEGACKSVIKMRTNGGGQRWRPTGLSAVLTLRALHQSDRLPRFWANFARRYRKEVMPLCA